MDHNISNFLIGIFYGVGDIFVIEHEFLNNIQFGQIIFIELELADVDVEFGVVGGFVAVELIYKFIENEVSLLGVHEVPLVY